MRRPLPLLILLAAFALGACGTRGSLTLPPPQSKAPPATSPAKPTPTDLNTAKDTAP